MSEELEAAAALGTASLAAAALPGSTAAHAKAAGHDSACRNCGATLAGSYCSACGQPAHLHRSLLHLGEEVLHGLYHFDAKGWRTLPLLAFKPGVLTRRYIDGQRVRYVSPLALFLFTVFLMFLVFSLTSGSPESTSKDEPPTALGPRETPSDAHRKAQEQVVEAQAALDKAKQIGDDVAGAIEDLREAMAEEKALATASGASGATSAASSAGGTTNSREVTYNGWREALRNMSVNTDSPNINAAVRRAAANPDLTLYKLKNTAYKFSFLLVPISLPFLWLMFFWRRGVAVYDHAVFALYSLSFMSLLLIVAALLSAAHLSAVLPLLLTFAPPIHMFVHLRGTYGLSIFSALWRTVALLVVASTVLCVFMLLIITVTMS